jgi:hypothetical protein
VSYNTIWITWHYGPSGGSPRTAVWKHCFRTPFLFLVDVPLGLRMRFSLLPVQWQVNHHLKQRVIMNTSKTKSENPISLRVKPLSCPWREVWTAFWGTIFVVRAGYLSLTSLRFSDSYISFSERASVPRLLSRNKKVTYALSSRYPCYGKW